MLTYLGLNKGGFIWIDIMVVQNTFHIINSFLNLFFIIRAARISKQIFQYKDRNIGTALHRTDDILTDYITFELV